MILYKVLLKIKVRQNKGVIEGFNISKEVYRGNYFPCYNRSGRIVDHLVSDANEPLCREGFHSLVKQRNVVLLFTPLKPGNHPPIPTTMDEVSSDAKTTELPLDEYRDVSCNYKRRFVGMGDSKVLSMES